jgi:uncharacterized protein YggE
MRFTGTLLVLGLIPSLARAQGARVEQTDSGPRIVASVTKVARVVPDRAMVYGSVEATAETPAEAVQRGEHKVQAIMEAIRQVSAA